MTDSENTKIDPKPMDTQPVNNGSKKIKIKPLYAVAAVVVIAAVIVVLFVVGGLGSKTSSSSIVKDGDNVSIYYTGSFTNGTVFDSNINGSPLSFIVGSDEMIPGVDNAVINMSVGQNKVVTIPPNEAYGYVNESIDKDLPLPLLEIAEIADFYYNTTNISIGNQFTFDGDSFNITSLPINGTNMSYVDLSPTLISGIIENTTTSKYLKDTNVTVDIWPALAGYSLVFNITVDKINS